MNPSPWPRDNEIHLYSMPLPHDASELTRCERLLSMAEADRARQLKSSRSRNRFIAGRGILRDILGGYLGIDPAKVSIATGDHGKPFLADGAEDLRFNLSHVDDLLVLAVAAGIEVGIDIEKIDAGKAIHDMARLAFSRREQEELRAMPAERQVEAFYRCWVRKEACLKACGRGFSLPGGSFSISLSHEATTIPQVCCNDAVWYILDLDVPYNYCGALAVELRFPDLPLPEPVLISYVPSTNSNIF